MITLFSGSTIRLTSDVIRKHLGARIFDQNNEHHLISWLGQQEDKHKMALYQCDFTFHAWTQRCIRQADCILIVGLGENTPSVGKVRIVSLYCMCFGEYEVMSGPLCQVEKEIQRIAVRTQKELVLLHREDGARPNNTVAWLNMRTWVSWHHHIQCSKRMFSRKSVYRIVRNAFALQQFCFFFTKPVCRVSCTIRCASPSRTSTRIFRG